MSLTNFAKTRERNKEGKFVTPTIPSTKSDSIDHATPLSRGGTNSLDNLIPCCVSCNSKKHDKTLVEFNPLLFVAWDRFIINDPLPQ